MDNELFLIMVIETEKRMIYFTFMIILTGVKVTKIYEYFDLGLNSIGKVNLICFLNTIKHLLLGKTNVYVFNPSVTFLHKIYF